MVLWCQCYTVTVFVESMVESPSRSAVCARSDPPQIRGSVAASAGGGHGTYSSVGTSLSSISPLIAAGTYVSVCTLVCTPCVEVVPSQ